MLSKGYHHLQHSKLEKMISAGIFGSSLIYKIQLWGRLNKTLISSLQILQNQTARIVTTLIKELQTVLIYSRQVESDYKRKLIQNCRSSPSPISVFKLGTVCSIQSGKLQRCCHLKTNWRSGLLWLYQLTDLQLVWLLLKKSLCKPIIEA